MREVNKYYVYIHYFDELNTPFYIGHIPSMKDRTFSEEIKQNMRHPHKLISKESRKNMGKGMIGRIPWNKGLRVEKLEGGNK